MDRRQLFSHQIGSNFGQGLGPHLQLPINVVRGERVGMYLNPRRLVGICLGLMLLAFQNCGVVPEDCATSDSSTCSTDSASTASTPKKNNTISVGSGGSGAAAPGGGTGAPGFSTGPGTVGGGGGSGVPGGAQPIPGGGAGGDGTGGNYQPGPFRITQQPQALTLDMGQDYQIGVLVNGGTPPFTFRWSINGVIDTSPYANYSSYYGTANRYDQEGAYSVTITDSTGTVLQSSSAQVQIRDMPSTCVARNYYGKVANNQYFEYYSSLFVNSRGTFYYPATYSEIAALNLDSFGANVLNTLGISRAPTSPSAAFGFAAGTFPNANFGQVVPMPCRNVYPGVHNPLPNPGYTPEQFQFGQDYQDGYNYVYDGAVNFECRGGKYQYRSNTCNWRFVPPPPENGGFGN